MNTTFDLGSLVRVKGQRGRPQKWVVSFLSDDPDTYQITQYNNSEVSMIVRNHEISPYPVKKTMVEEVV